MVELWFEGPIELDVAALTAALHRRDETIDVVGDAKLPMIFHPRFEHTYSDGKAACINHPLFIADGAPDRQLDLGQSWFFPDAQSAPGRVHSTMLIGQMLGAANPWQQRLDAFTDVLGAVLEVTEPFAIWCPNSQQLVDPVNARQQPLEALINIRLFNISNDPGTMVMDSLGLHVFGLPDVQCHFRDLDPGEMFRVLFNTAAYLTERGDVIADGETIPGITGTEKWHCRHEAALVGPEREVLDIDPGDPYAAGGRDR